MSRCDSGKKKKKKKRENKTEKKKKKKKRRWKWRRRMRENRRRMRIGRMKMQRKSEGGSASNLFETSVKNMNLSLNRSFFFYISVSRFVIKTTVVQSVYFN